MFSVKLKNVNIDNVVESLKTCQAQSIIHWIVRDEEDQKETNGEIKTQL